MHRQQITKAHSSTTKGSVKSFSNLDQLVDSRKMNPPAIVTMANDVYSRTSVSVSVELDPNAPLSENIFRIMSDYKGRTIPELITALKSVEPDADTVKSTMIFLNNAGWFDYTKPAAFKDVVYTLKRNLKNAIVEKGTMKKTQTVRPFKMATTGIIDPAGVVKVTESLDLSIWKVTADRKARTCAEIGELLAAFGINRELAKDRFMKLVNKGWYIRQQRHKVTYYTLKKGIPMPVDENAKEQNAIALKAVPQTTKLQNVPVTVIPKNAQLVLEATVQPIKSEPKETPVLKTTPVILESDSIFIKIWKVMSDYKPYTSNEICLLLSEFDVKAGTVSSRLSILNNTHGWFTVESVGRGFAYTLKRDIPMPDDSFIGDPRTMANHEVKSTPVESQAMTKPAKTPVHVTASTPSTPPAPALVTPLVEIIIRVKGIDLTFMEAREITKVLKSQGYGQGYGGKNNVSSNNLLISTNVCIKGQTFMPEELETITRQFIANNFDK